jgi:hypothetical protein
VSVELSMGGDYYHACCGGPDPDPKPEGPQVPYVGNKVSHISAPLPHIAIDLFMFPGWIIARSAANPVPICGRQPSGFDPVSIQ